MIATNKIRSARQVQDMITGLVEAAFSLYDLDFNPMFPNMLVYVLDRNQERKVGSGLIIAPQTTQQPYTTAVVVRPYAPKNIPNGRTIECVHKEGDLVLMPYWGGVPCSTIDTDGNIFRFVPENIAIRWKEGKVEYQTASQADPHVFGKVGFLDVKKIIGELVDLIKSQNDRRASAEQSLIDIIKTDYIVLPKKML